MPRGPTSNADQELIEELAGREIDVSAYQLERWRGLGLLPPAKRRALGRGAGSTSAYPPGTVELVAGIAKHQRRGRPARLVTLALFADGLPVSEAMVRAALEHQIEWLGARRPPAQSEAEEDEAFAAARRRVQRLLSTDPFFAEYLDPFGVRPGRRRAGKIKAKEMRHAVELADAAASLGFERLSAEQLVELYGALGIELDREAIEESLGEGERLDARFSTNAHRDALRLTTWEELCRARDTVNQVQVHNSLLSLFALSDPVVSDFAVELWTDRSMALMKVFGNYEPEKRYRAAQRIPILLSSPPLGVIAARYSEIVSSWLAENLEALVERQVNLPAVLVDQPS